MYVNAHTHVYSGLVPFGMPPPARAPRTFIQILERVWWRLDRALDARALRAAARYYVADALRHGTTTLVDHHESPACIEGSLEVIADACQELGARAVLCYGATERNFGRDEARRGLDECRRFIRDNSRPLVRGIVGLHASFTVGDETVREAGALCDELGTVLHVHLAEDRFDVKDARKRGHDGPLERLIDLGAVPPGSILAHGVHLTERQVRGAEAAGCWIVQNPRSNDHNRVGYPASLTVGRRVAVGTDGFPSDMRVEQATLMRLGAAHDEREADLAERLARGADLALERFGIELKDTCLWPQPECAGTETLVERLVIDGRTIIEGGGLVTGDWDAIVAEAREEAARLWSRLA
jgi:cytosine/adenosine deaminase-related metal-dependent hydrolase